MRMPLGRATRATIHMTETPQLKEQRSKRPLSPHLTIYQPQLTWLMSIGHRVTGAGLAGLLYAFGIYYGIAAPEMVTNVLAEGVSGMASGLVVGGKFVLALPFWYHLANGVRHLAWDWGKGLSLKATYASGYAVNAFSVIAAILSAI